MNKTFIFQIQECELNFDFITFALRNDVLGGVDVNGKEKIFRIDWKPLICEISYFSIPMFERHGYIENGNSLTCVSLLWQNEGNPKFFMFDYHTYNRSSKPIHLKNIIDCRS